MKQNDFDYMQMLKGELYYAPTILPENKSTKGKVLAQKINQLPIDNVKEIVALEKELLGKTGNELYRFYDIWCCYSQMSKDTKYFFITKRHLVVL